MLELFIKYWPIKDVGIRKAMNRFSIIAVIIIFIFRGFRVL